MYIDLSTIPVTPGVYMFKDAQGRIVYVGKAKHLRRRVSSYFRGQHRHSPKTAAMLAVAESLDTLSTNTEKEALLLEASLIKKHRPRYNIVLRDDKQYLLFHIDKAQEYPRLSIVRPRAAKSKKGETFRASDDGETDIPVLGRKGRDVFYGPYTSALAARETWRVIHRIFPLRRCSNRSFKNRVRPCLYYHLGQCLAPCVLPVEPSEYNAVLQRVELFLSGRSGELLEQLNDEMLKASDELNFEQAAKLRDQIVAVKQTLEKQSAVLHGVGDMDVIGLAEICFSPRKDGEKQQEDCLGLGILFVRQGQVLGGKTFYWPGLGLEEGPEVLLAFMTQFYDSATLIPGRILVPWDFSVPLSELDEKKSEAENRSFWGAGKTDVGSDALESERTETVSSERAGFSEAWDGLGELVGSDGAGSDDKLNDMALLQELLSERRGGQAHIITPRSELEKRLVSMAATNAREGAFRSAHTDMSELLANRLSAPKPIERIEAVDVSHTGGTEAR
ncbi:MAG: UvrB/UvrC motif-containing protein, partial [Desulfovibrionaceae bacterium]|nr:UvrB/UvrC motif-containing protein [Desulfovibrionaceae bacterium]